MKLIHLLPILVLLTGLILAPCPVLAVGQVNFSLSPATISPKAGENFNLNLSANSGNIKLDALEVTLKFDPNKLELVSFQTNNTFNAEVRKTIDNKAGTLLWTTTDITKPRKPISGNLNLGTLIFKAKSGGQTNIVFQKAQVGSIDSPSLTTSNISTSVNVTGSESILDKIKAFFAGIFKK